MISLVPVSSSAQASNVCRRLNRLVDLWRTGNGPIVSVVVGQKKVSAFQHSATPTDTFDGDGPIDTDKLNNVALRLQLRVREHPVHGPYVEELTA